MTFRYKDVMHNTHIFSDCQRRSVWLELDEIAKSLLGLSIFKDVCQLIKFVTSYVITVGHVAYLIGSSALFCSSKFGFHISDM